MKPNLVEFARRMHGCWARRRAAQGVQYGPARTETTHPGLVDDWADLPPQEKEFDLGFASDVFQCLRDMGFEIVPQHEKSQDAQSNRG